MTVQEYFNQAYRLDQRINSKIEQVSALNDLAHKATATYTGMPHGPNKGSQTMSNTIDRIIDLEDEINHDIDMLVDLKRDIVKVIKSVDSNEYQVLLELRYLCFKTWEQIAVEMGYSIHHLYKVHRQALEAAEKWIPNDTI